MSNQACNHKLTIFNNGKKIKIGFHKKQDRDDLIRIFQNLENNNLFSNDDAKNEISDYCWSRSNSHRSITLVTHDMAIKLPAAIFNLYRDQKNSLNNKLRQILIVIPFKGQGSRSRMLDELIDLASKEQLCWLELKVMADLEPVIESFQSKKFEVRAIFENYLMDAQGKKHDVALMMRPL